MMKAISILSIAAIFLAACTLQDPFSFSGDLRIGTILEGELETETPDTFNLSFDSDAYIYGSCRTGYS